MMGRKRWSWNRFILLVFLIVGRSLEIIFLYLFRINKVIIDFVEFYFRRSWRIIIFE